MFIFSTPFVGRVARILIVSLIMVLLALPIIICSSVDSFSARVTIIILSMIVFLFVVSGLVTRKTTELFLAGAT